MSIMVLCLNHTIFEHEHPGLFLRQLHGLVPRNVVLGDITRFFEMGCGFFNLSASRAMDIVVFMAVQIGV